MSRERRFKTAKEAQHDTMAELGLATLGGVMSHYPRFDSAGQVVY